MTTTADIALAHGVELRQHGSTLRGLCPLHDRDGRNPSFTIFENWRWRCWSCGEGGDRDDMTPTVTQKLLDELESAVPRVTPEEAKLLGM